MTSAADSDEQRRLLRQQLRTQRRELNSMLNLAPSADHDAFPRSMTMRMLTGKSTLLMVLLAEALPLLLRWYMTKPRNSAKDK